MSVLGFSALAASYNNNMQSDKQKLSHFLRSKKVSQFCLPLMLVVIFTRTGNYLRI